MAAEEAPAHNLEELKSDLEKSSQTAANLLDALARKLKATRAAHRIGSAARYVQAHSMREVATGIERWIRRRPASAILAATIAGFVVGRALRPKRPR